MRNAMRRSMAVIKYWRRIGRSRSGTRNPCQTVPLKHIVEPNVFFPGVIEQALVD